MRVVDTTPPELTVLPPGDGRRSRAPGTSPSTTLVFDVSLGLVLDTEDPGARAVDLLDGDLTANVTTNWLEATALPAKFTVVTVSVRSACSGLHSAPRPYLPSSGNTRPNLRNVYVHIRPPRQGSLWLHRLSSST